MGLLDIFSRRDSGERQIKTSEAVKNRMAIPKEAFPSAGTAGWDAIVEEFERVYPGQKRPLFFKTRVRWIDGGNDPLDAIFVYDGGDYWHFVGLGLSELYGKVTDDPTKSGWGMEFTFKLKKGPFENEEEEIKGVCNILQSMARLTMRKGQIFEPYQYIFTGQAGGIDARAQSVLTGLITVPDASVNTIETPNGEVHFIEFVGMSSWELAQLKSSEDVIAMYERIGTDVTDYFRQSLC